jgi:hypothetical protein
MCYYVFLIPPFIEAIFRPSVDDGQCCRYILYPLLWIASSISLTHSLALKDTALTVCFDLKVVTKDYAEMLIFRPVFDGLCCRYSLQYTRTYLLVSSISRTLFNPNRHGLYSLFRPKICHQRLYRKFLFSGLFLMDYAADTFYSIPALVC